MLKLISRTDGKMRGYSTFIVFLALVVFSSTVVAQSSASSGFTIRLWFENLSTDTGYSGSNSRLPGEVAAMVFDPTDDRGVGVIPKVSRAEDGTLLLEFPEENLKLFNNQLYLRLLMFARYHAPKSKELILKKDSLTQVREEGGILLKSSQLVRERAEKGLEPPLVDQLRAIAEALDPQLHSEYIKKLEKLIAFELSKKQAESKPRGIIVPAYIYPSNPGAVAAGDRMAISYRTDWEKIINAAKYAARAKIAFWVIVNPNSGPGEQANADYTAVLNDLRRAGAFVLGYVAAGQGDGQNRIYFEEQRIGQSLTKWKAFYPQIQGFFIDTVPESEDGVDSIRSVVEKARAVLPGCKVALNPGQLCDSAYFELEELADLICVNENNAGIVDWEIPDWLNEFPATKICVIGWDMEEKDIAPAIANIRNKNAGFVYLTDRDDKVDLDRNSYPDPGLQWGHLPTPRFWQKFLQTAGQTVRPGSKTK